MAALSPRRGPDNPTIAPLAARMLRVGDETAIFRRSRGTRAVYEHRLGIGPLDRLMGAIDPRPSFWSASVIGF